MEKNRSFLQRNKTIKKDRNGHLMKKYKIEKLTCELNSLVDIETGRRFEGNLRNKEE